MIVEQELPKMALEGLSEEEARAERKRRQRQAQEEFRLKQLMKQQDDKQELGRNSSSFDHLLLEIPTQDIMIEAAGEESGKRKSPGPDGAAVAKRRNSFKGNLDSVQID